MAASWYLAPSLAQLRTEVDRRWPGRSRASDGTIGDLAHSARKSEHNPDAGGVVRAIDITVAGLDKATLLDAVIGDSRVHYVISDRRIYSRHSGWKPKPYSGTNPHTKHVHVSIRNSTSETTTAAVRKAAATDTSQWFKTPTPTLTQPDRIAKEIADMKLTDIVPSTGGLTVAQCLARGAWAYAQIIDGGKIANRATANTDARAQWAYASVIRGGSLESRVAELERRLEQP